MDKGARVEVKQVVPGTWLRHPTSSVGVQHFIALFNVNGVVEELHRISEPCLPAWTAG